MAKKKAMAKKRINCLGKEVVVDIPLFGATGHTNYSGFGRHEDALKREDRRARKIEAKRISREYYND